MSAKRPHPPSTSRHPCRSLRHEELSPLLTGVSLGGPVVHKRMILPGKRQMMRGICLLLSVGVSLALSQSDIVPPSVQYPSAEPSGEPFPSDVPPSEPISDAVPPSDLTLEPLPAIGPLPGPMPDAPASDSAANPVESGSAGQEAGVAPGEDLRVTDDSAATADVLEAIATKRESHSILWNYSAFVGAVYDDNLFLKGVDKISDFVMEVGARATVSRGVATDNRFFSLTYGPSYRMFLDNSQLDGLNHDAGAAYGFSFGSLSGSVSARYTNEIAADRNVADYTRRQNFVLGADFFYEVSTKTRVVGGFNYSIADYDIYLGYSDWRGRVGMDYAVTGKTRLGLNAEHGSMLQEESEARPYDRVNGTLLYEVTGKTRLSLSGGADWRDEPTTGASDVRAVFSLQSSYAMDAQTLITLGGSRDFTGSPSEKNQTFSTTRLDLSVTRKLTDRITLNGTFGYNWISYPSTGTSTNTGREDGYWTSKLQATYQVSQRFAAQVFYEHLDNASNQSVADFSTNRLGASVSVSF